MGNPRRSNSHRRNQIRARILNDEDTCWAPFCRKPVYKTTPPGLPSSPEVHEIIPVSRGGSPYERSNCTLTHRECNRIIGNRTPQELARDLTTEPSTPTTTLAAW
jgi:5-methylcytosine-specific restriction endonuclease McrA